MSFNKSILIIFCVLLIDQFSKIYIKLHFPLTLYSSDALMDWGWFKILFVENKGMAWGAKISDFIPFISERVGKFILTSVWANRLMSCFFFHRRLGPRDGRREPRGGRAHARPRSRLVVLRYPQPRERDRVVGDRAGDVEQRYRVRGDRRRRLRRSERRCVYFCICTGN